MDKALYSLGVRSARHYKKVTYEAPRGELRCPICYRSKREWEIHHVIPRIWDGRDIQQNLVAICIDCHQVIHSGDKDESKLLIEILNDFMRSNYGLVNIGRNTLKMVIKNFPDRDWKKISTWRKLHHSLRSYSDKRYMSHIFYLHFNVIESHD